MIQEKSAGVIVFKYNPRDGLQYLLLYHRGTYWNFPKGKVDSGETETQTAVRELEEEAGIKGVKLVNGWRQETHFFFKEDRQGKKELIKKDFLIYLAQMPKNTKVNISSEHNGYGWFDFKTASKYLRFKNLKEILAEADSYINDKIKQYKKSKKNNKKN